METLNGKITKILTQKENDWGRYVITNYGEKITAVGIIKGACIGSEVILEGITEDTQYGRQFTIKKATAKSTGLEGIKRFLAGGFIKGLGEKKATIIVNTYGKDCLELFETPEGHKKLCAIKGLGEKSIKRILESYEENKKYKDIVLFLNGMGTLNQIEKIYNMYGEKSVSEIKKNPYRLQEIEGFGFIKVDNLAMQSGIKANSIYRLMAAARYVIEEASYMGGHCYIPINEISEKVEELLVKTPTDNEISQTKITNAIKNWEENKEKFIKDNSPSGELISDITNVIESRRLIKEGITDALLKAFEEGTLINDNGDIYINSLYNAETKAAKLIVEMTKENPVRYIKPELLDKCIIDVEKRKTENMHKNGCLGEFCFTPEQISAVRLGLMNRISIISGGPGRGKTAISELIAYTFIMSGKTHNKEDIIMLAPTGRAAQRITESTGYPAMTIHRAVMLAESEELPRNKLIIADESSMIDIFLMSKLLEFGKHCNLILVGDVDQIPSVGPGKVLKDLISSKKIPCILLKEGHRNSGPIAHNSELINKGVKISKYTYNKDEFTYLPITKENVLDVVVHDYKAKVKQYGIENIMLCTAMKDRGSCSVKGLNTRLQEVYTKGNKEIRFGESLYRVGDRVMQTKNDYHFVLDTRVGVFNGEKGTVTAIEYDEINDVSYIVVKFDDGSIGKYNRENALNLILAYATTLHKCQGSEASCMMLVSTFADYILMKRSLFYTGETRAKKEFRFYGEEKKTKYGMWSVFDMAVSNIDDTIRNTKLEQRIIDLIEEE